MKILLGSGEQKEEWFLSVDISDQCGADIVADVREPWDWATEPIEMIKSDNLLEHLTWEETKALMNQAWEKMAPGGLFWIRVPLAVSFSDNLEELKDHLMAAMTDPSHKTFYTTQTFDYYDMDHQRGKVYGRDYGLKLWKRVRNEEWNKRFLIVELVKP